MAAARAPLIDHKNLYLSHILILKIAANIMNPAASQQIGACPAALLDPSFGLTGTAGVNNDVHIYFGSSLTRELPEIFELARVYFYLVVTDRGGDMSRPLAGRVALVTGASSGIGEAAAVALAAAGAAVAVSARRAERLHELVKKIEAAGGKAFALPGDVAVETVATSIVADTVKHFGKLDILVNSAGVIQAGGVENADTEQWRRVIEINLMASLYTCAAAIGPMRAQGGGDIVNISSTAGRRAIGIFNPYATSKFGLNAMTEGMRQEIGKYGIRVCIVEPGATTTEVSEGVTDPKAREFMRQHVSKEGAMKSEDVAEAIVFVVSLPRRANVSEILIRPTIDTAPM